MGRPGSAWPTRISSGAPAGPARWGGLRPGLRTEVPEHPLHRGAEAGGIREVAHHSGPDGPPPRRPRGFCSRRGLVQRDAPPIVVVVKSARLCFRLRRKLRPLPCASSPHRAGRGGDPGLKHQKETASRPVEKKKCFGGSVCAGADLLPPAGEGWLSLAAVRDGNAQPLGRPPARGSLGYSCFSFRCRWPVVDEGFSIGQRNSSFRSPGQRVAKRNARKEEPVEHW